MKYMYWCIEPTQNNIKNKFNNDLSIMHKSLNYDGTIEKGTIRYGRLLDKIFNLFDKNGLDFNYYIRNKNTIRLGTKTDNINIVDNISNSLGNGRYNYLSFDYDGSKYMINIPIKEVFFI